VQHEYAVRPVRVGERLASRHDVEGHRDQS
jgi:hypothetical protein